MSTPRYKAHLAHIAKRRKSGARILSYCCPSCGGIIETPVPSNKKEVWDTFSTCPFCEGLHFKVARSNKVTGTVPEEFIGLATGYNERNEESTRASLAEGEIQAAHLILDQLGAPRLQLSGMPYSIEGRLRKLSAKNLGDSK